MGCSAKSSDAGIILFKIGEVLIKGLNAGWAKKGYHVVKNLGKVGQIAANSPEKHRRGEIIPILQQELLRLFSGNIRTRVKEFFAGVFFQHFGQV